MITSHTAASRNDDATQAVWRIVGDPLVPPSGSGNLNGETVAVKDLFAVAGQQVGAGVPEYLAGSPMAQHSAAAVERLLAAGAAIAGLAQTDQFAYSVAGVNEHYGAPPNPAVPLGIPGGSSSGPASAVSLRQASIGLGTDTAGSIRVPASYQGLWGFRPTLHAIPMDGVLPLAPDFDTVGVITASGERLSRAARVLLHDRPGQDIGAGGTLVVDPAIRDSVEPEVAKAFAALLLGFQALGIRIGQIHLEDIDRQYAAFRTHQAFQAWQAHGPWLEAHPTAVVGAAADRFRAAAAVTAEDDRAARHVLAETRRHMQNTVGEQILVLPTTSSAAPLLSAAAGDVDRVRQATLRLTTLASVLGRPAVSLPAITTDSGPVGLCLVGAKDTDLALIAAGRQLSRDVAPTAPHRH